MIHPNIIKLKEVNNLFKGLINKTWVVYGIWAFRLKSI